MKTMPRTRFFQAAILALVAILQFANMSFAEIPKTINFQGRLTDKNGAPLTDANYSIRVFLYDQADGAYGTRPALWSDLFDAPTKNGYFNIALGSGVEKLNNVDFNQSLYVGIKVGNEDEMKPCHPLNSVPYAMIAMNGVPVGTILPWHPNISTPPLPIPEGFEPCNGQAVAITCGPLKGKTINLPNLNGWSGGAFSPGFNSRECLFLRGGLVSGIGEADKFKDHSHTLQGWRPVVSSTYRLEGGPHSQATVEIQTNGATEGAGTETRPKNMSVVWIMRVK